MTTTPNKTITRKAPTAKGRAKQAAAAKTADSKAKHTGTITALKPIAKEINVRFIKAAKLDGQADDHRLAAAMKLAEAKAKCEADKMNFKKWAEENVSQGYETVRKLVAVGAADNPQAALEDLRGKNKDANKKLRDKQAKVSRDTKEGARDAAPTVAPLTPFGRAEAALEALEDTVRVNVLGSAAGDVGMVMIAEKAHNDLKAEAKKAKAKQTLAAIKAAFDKLKASDKMDLLEYVADAVGATVDIPFATVDAEHGADEIDLDAEMPEALRADTKKKAA
jgi:hypothetical protein